MPFEYGGNDIDHEIEQTETKRAIPEEYAAAIKTTKQRQREAQKVPKEKKRGTSPTKRGHQHGAGTQQQVSVSPRRSPSRAAGHKMMIEHVAQKVSGQ
jgi:hypothetical protein